MGSMVWAAFAVIIQSAVPQVVVVQSDRVTLGDVVPGVPEPWAGVDLGPSPKPLQQRAIQQAHMRSRIGAAKLAPAPVALPARVTVKRDGTTVTEPELRNLVSRALREQLPASTVVRNATVSGGVVVGVGDITVVVDTRNVVSGRQTLLAAVGSSDGVQVVVPILVDVQKPQGAAGRAVNRGQEVTIVLNQGNVRVQSHGIAQQAGAIGDIVTVTPAQGSRVLRGRIVDGQTVEVGG